jgi:LPXTG-motif cell wall-anchored protein
MKNSKIGIGVMAIAIFIIGMGIGLKLGDSEMNITLFTVVGLALSAIGFLILVRANKKTDEMR